MDDTSRTKAELIKELVALRAEVATLKQAVQLNPPSVMQPPLIQQEQLLAGFINAAAQANIGWFIVDTDLHYLQINSVLADFNGHSVEYHLGKRLPDVLPDLASTLEPVFQTLIESRQPILNLEVSGSTPSRPDELRHWLDSYFPIISATGEVVAIGGIVIEITAYKQTIEALRRSEADLQTAQRLAHVGSWSWDCINRVGVWSEEMYRIHGCDPTQSPPRGAELERYIHPDDLPLHHKLVEQASAGHPFEVDLRIVRPNGEVRYVEARGEPGVFNQQGELLRLFGTVLDVTERKRVEAALRQSEFALREAQRLAHVGNWTWTPETGTVWSEEVYRIHGLDPIIAPPDRSELMKYTYPEDCAIHNAIIEATYMGQAYEFDLRIIRPSGETRYVEVRGEPGLRNNQGEIVALFGTVLDVTERKQVEARLRQSEANLARAQKIAHIGSWEYDLISQSCTWSKELYRIHQLDPSQPIPVGEAMDRLIHPDDLWIDRQLIKTPLQAGLPCEADLRIIRQDGEIRHIEVRAEPVFDGQGRLIQWSGTVLDITDRKCVEEKLRRSEAEIRAILETIPDMLLQIRQDSTMLFVEPGELKPYKPIAEMIGKSIYDILPPEIACQRMKYVQQAIQTDEKQIFEYEIVIDDKLRHQEARIVAINPEEALVVIRDITEKHRLEQLKTEFISVVSHELRTPLTSIQVALSLLDAHLVEPTSADGQAMIHTATEGVDRLVRLVNDILDLERLELSKIIISKQPCNVVELVNIAVEQMRNLAEQSNIHFQVATEPWVIAVDPDRLVQVLTNLLSNAIRFSPPHSTVQICVEVLPPDSSHSAQTLQIKVEDQGRGIPESQLDCIFERFQQVDASDSREKGGTGLGLAICRSIIQQHGGQIWAESRLGQGSTFFFTLPFQEHC